LNVVRNSSFNSKTTAATESTHVTEPTDDVSDSQRHVRFATKSDVHHRITLSRNDYTPEEMTAFWYQDADYAMISKDCCKQIKKMQNSEVLKDKKYCSRGLESHTRLASISKMQNRKTANNAVLDEQEEQRHMGVVDEEIIAQRYQQTTSSCQLWANIVGLRDQRVAEEYID
jgi:hypothetical protein